MNILMVLSNHSYPPDRRVEWEGRDLIRDGHQLFLMARRNPDQQAEEIVYGVHVIRVPVLFLGRRIVEGMFYFFFQRYFMFFHILRACRKHRINALHVHDLPYAFATALAGKLMRIPVVFDMHEHFTAMVRMSYESKSYRWLRPLAFLQLMPLRLEERLVCRWARKVIVVADEHIPRIEALGAARKDIVVVTNTEDSDYFANLPIDESVMKDYADNFILLYVGAFSPHRGLETVIHAMPSILEKIPNARFLLVGDGFTRRELEWLVENLGLTERVTFAGYQPFEALPTYIRHSDVCVIPHISTPQIEMTMPNKIFQFMVCGGPVLVSSTRPMMRVVRDAECGLIFEERNPASLAEEAIKLGDERLRQRLGENGKRAVADRYNWQKTVEILLHLYRSPT